MICSIIISINTIGVYGPTSPNILVVFDRDNSYSGANPSLFYLRVSKLLNDYFTNINEIKSTVVPETTNFDFYDVIIHLGTDSYYAEYRAYVENGGGLFVVPGYDLADGAGRYLPFVNFLPNFGVLMDTSHSGNAESGGLLLADHEINTNVWNVTFKGTNYPLTITNSANIPILLTNNSQVWETYDNLPLMIAREYGAGRVVLSPIRRQFDDINIEADDNWVLFLNIVHWLAELDMPDVDFELPELKDIETEITEYLETLDNLREEKSILEDELETIQNQIDEEIVNSTKYQQLLTEFLGIAGNYDDLNTTYANLLSDYVDLSGLSNSLMLEKDSIEAELNELKADYAELSNILDGLQSNYDDLTDLIEELKEQADSSSNNGIPGFPTESIVFSILLASFVMWMMRRKNSIIANNYS